MWKTAGQVANSADPDQTPRSAASDLGLHYLLRPACHYISGKYGISYFGYFLFEVSFHVTLTFASPSFWSRLFHLYILNGQLTQIGISVKCQERNDGSLPAVTSGPTLFAHVYVVVNQAPRLYKLFSCSTQLSMKFVLLINLKLLKVANSFLLSLAEITKVANSFLLSLAEYEIFSANKYENANKSWHFHIY